MRCLRTALIERRLARPDIEPHAQAFQGDAEHREHPVAAPHLQLVDQLSRQARRVRGSRSNGVSVPVAGLGNQCGRKIGDVLSPVAVFRHREVDAQLLCVACRQRLAELGHLRAVVVHVELARDVVAGEVEDAAERVAVGGVARVPHMQGPGRIDAHELDVGATPLVRRQHVAAVVGAAVDHALHGAAIPGRREKQVEEAGAGHFVAVAQAGPVPLHPGATQLVGQLTRRTLGSASEHQGGVGAHIPVLGPGRHTELDHADGGHRRREGALQRSSQTGEVVQFGHRSPSSCVRPRV